MVWRRPALEKVVEIARNRERGGTQVLIRYETELIRIKRIIRASLPGTGIPFTKTTSYPEAAISALQHRQQTVFKKLDLLLLGCRTCVLLRTRILCAG